jgi:phage shock protein C
MEKKLYRSLKNRMIAGVCGGIGEYFGIDPTLVRLGWVLFVCLGGSGLLAYIICAFVVPNAPAD